MAITAPTLFKLVLLITWGCLCDTPLNSKHTFFARFFEDLEKLESTASMCDLTFAPGLFDVLQASIPPTVQYFQTLPKEWKNRWGIYALIFENEGCRPRLYVGSGTAKQYGVYSRLRQYDSKTSLPQYVEYALNNGFIITSKGLLCWCDLPSPANIPIYRLLFIALEAALAYTFGAMRAATRDYFVRKPFVWEKTSFEYDGLCSHCALNEQILGDFDLTTEQLEASAAEQEQKRKELKAINNTNWHYHKMENNYDEYMGAANARVAKSRAANPGRDRQRQADRIAKAIANKTFHCVPCNFSHGTKQRLQLHEKRPQHLAVVAALESSLALG